MATIIRIETILKGLKITRFRQIPVHLHLVGIGIKSPMQRPSYFRYFQLSFRCPDRTQL